MRKMLFLTAAVVCFAAGYLFTHKIGFGSDYGYAENEPLLCQLVATDNSHARTLIWLDADQEGGQFVEYRLRGGTEMVRAAAERETIQNKENTARPLARYSVRLTELKAGSVYEYRVGRPNEWSSWQPLQTILKGQRFTALVFGDSQSEDYQVWQDTACGAYGRHPEAQLFINMGDLTDNGESISQWRAWFDAIRPFSSKLPLAPVSGNHENYTLDWRFTTADVYNAIFTLPDNGSPERRGQWYSFDYGSAHFVVLDTQAEELAEFFPKLFIEEAAWLEKDLAKSHAAWKIALLHRNPFDSTNPEQYNAVGKTFVPLLEKCGVRLVLTAHNHAYSRTVPLKGNVPTSDGIVYISTGRSGDKPWENNTAKPQDAFYYNPIQEPNYLTLSVGEDALEIACYSAGGSAIDKVTLKK